MQSMQHDNVNQRFRDNEVTVGARSGYANLLPREKARALCREVIWWHNKTGNDVSLEDIFSKTRSRQIALARGDCIRRLRETLNWSYPHIASFFKIDHTTAIHHCQKKEVVNAALLPKANSAITLFERKRVQHLAQEQGIEWRMCAERPTYEISSNGLVRNFKSKILLNQRRDMNGHYYVVFNGWADSIDRTHAVRILVAEAFIGPWDWSRNVIHLDGNRYNNRASNLAYAGVIQAVQPNTKPHRQKASSHEEIVSQPVL